MDRVIKPLNFNAENWDLFSADCDQYEKDWEQEVSYEEDELFEPSISDTLEVQS